MLYKVTLVHNGARFQGDPLNRSSISLSKAALFRSPIALGFVFAMGSAALFALRPVLVKLIYLEGVDSATLIFLRMAFSAPIYLVMLAFLLRSKTRRQHFSSGLLLQVASVGVLGYCFASYLDLLGLQYVSAQLGRMILYVYPTFVVLLGMVFFSTRITVRTVASLLITYAGVAVIFGHDLAYFGTEIIQGAAYIIAAAFCFAGYLLFSKPLMVKMGSAVFTCIALLSASAGIFAYYGVIFFGNGGFATVQDIVMTDKALLLIFIIAIFCTVIPSFLTTAAVVRIGADRTSIIAMIGPAFTSAFAVLLLSEAFTVAHFAGAVLVIVGVAFLQRKG